VNYVVGPFFVRRIDIKLFAEFSGFEVDIVKADTCGNLVQEVFRPDKKRFEKYGAVDNDQRDVMISTAFARAGRIMVVAADELPAGESTLHNVAGVAVVALLQTVKIHILRIERIILFGAEEEALAERPCGKLFSTLAGGVDVVYDCHDGNNCNN